jgi:hypothetical protein
MRGLDCSNWRITLENGSFVLRLRRLIRTIEASSGLGELDDTGRRTLDFIAEAEFDGRSLRMSDIVKVPDFGTPPTVYGRLAEMEAGGWIRFAADPRDGRVKLVRLTAAARRTFARISEEARRMSSGA